MTLGQIIWILVIPKEKKKNVFFWLGSPLRSHEAQVTFVRLKDKQEVY